MFTSTPEPDSAPNSKRLKRVSAATMAVVVSATVIGAAPQAQAQSSNVDHFTGLRGESCRFFRPADECPNNTLFDNRENVVL